MKKKFEKLLYMHACYYIGHAMEHEKWIISEEKLRGPTTSSMM